MAMMGEMQKLTLKVAELESAPPKASKKSSKASSDDEEKPARKANPWVEFQKAHKGQMKGWDEDEKKEKYAEWKAENGYETPEKPKPAAKPAAKAAKEEKPKAAKAAKEEKPKAASPGAAAGGGGAPAAPKKDEEEEEQEEY